MAVNQIKAGAVLSYIVLGLNNLVGLLYVPYMLRMMGTSEYGLYSLAGSVIAYLTILDLGFGNAIVRYTAKFRAEGRLNEQYAMFGMFLRLYTVIGLAAFAIGLCLYFNIDNLFGETMSAVELDRARVLIMLLLANLAVTFPLSIFGSIVTAYENFVFLKVVHIVRILLNTAVMVYLLHRGYKAVALVVVQTFFNIATLLLNFIYCKYKLRIKILFEKFQWGFLREVALYSFWIFLNIIVERIYWSSGQFVLGSVVGTAAVTVFALAIQLQMMYMSFSMAISGVFLPRITAMVTTNCSDKALSDIFVRTGRIQYIIIAFILSGFMLFGRQFIALWAGNGYEDTYYIALIFFAAMTIPLIQNIGISILQARNSMKFNALMCMSIAVVSIAAQIPLSRQFGSIGCAAAIAIAVFIGQGLIMNIYYRYRQRIDIGHFWHEIAKMSVVPLLVGSATWAILQYVELNNVLNLGVAMLLYSLVYIPLIWIGSMNSDERELIYTPIKKWMKNALAR